MNNVLIELNNIRCHLTREQQFHQLNWQLSKGDNWVFYGPNGGGKTALAKVASGLLPISSGERHFSSEIDPTKDIAWVSVEAQQALQALDNRFDNSNEREDAFDAGTTVKQIIFQGQEPCPASLALIKNLHMEGFLNNGIRYVSSGQLRKTLLMKVFVQKPKIAILDDPMAGLDPDSQQHVKTLVEQLADSPTQVLLLLRRKQDLVAGFDRYAVLENCCIVETGIVDAQFLAKRKPQALANAPTKLALPLNREKLGAGSELVKLTDIHANYRDTLIFEHQNFYVNAGEHVAISGPNGCGKSTLMNLITGENHMAYGQDVRLFGKKRGTGESVWEIKHQFGIVSNAIHESYGRGWIASQVVISGLYDSIGLYDKPSDQDQMAALTCLKFLGIGHQAKRKFQQLSYGEQRLVLLARAIIKQPPILLLDEACTGLDDAHKDLFLACLERLMAATDITLINMTHLSDEQPSCIAAHWHFEPNQQGLHDIVRKR